MNLVSPLGLELCADPFGDLGIDRRITLKQVLVK
jgi:hypothetical protein